MKIFIRNNVKRLHITLFLPIILSGCIGSLVPVQSLDKTGIDVLMSASKLPVVSADTAKNMIVIGEVVGHSCMNKSNEHKATQVGASDQAKIIAVQRGATAITDLVCTEGGVSLFKNCWQSWECKGTALR